MDWADQQKPPRAYVGGPAQIRVVENGPVRVAVEVVRETEGSNDAADVKQCRTQTSSGAFTGDTCPRAGGLDQNIYGDKAP